MSKKLNETEKIGCFNESADKMKREDDSWSVGDLDHKFTSDDYFTRLVCNYCNGVSFEVLHIFDYTTAAKCDGCGKYFVVQDS